MLLKSTIIRTNQLNKQCIGRGVFTGAGMKVLNPNSFTILQLSPMIGASGGQNA